MTDEEMDDLARKFVMAMAAGGTKWIDVGIEIARRAPTDEDEEAIYSRVQLITESYKGRPQ
jgi:hypothetical protein